MPRLAAPAAALLLALPFLPFAVADPPPDAADPADYVLLFSRLPDDRRSYGGDAVTGAIEPLRALVVHAGDARALERRAARDPDVVAFERDAEAMQALLVPTDPLYASYQYDLQPAATDMESAWDATLGAGARVCVVDTGQYRDHQDLAGVAWAGWRDFVAGKAKPYDDNGHGTHVTGTVAAALGNGKGVAGVAPAAAILGAKVLNRQGSGTFSAVANGVTWCADQGAHVVNLSLGGPYSATVEAAVRYADAAGALVVAAAGNAGPCQDCVGYPARQAEALAVACTDAANAQCGYSSEGPEIDVAAPGDRIASTYPAGVQPCNRKNTNCYVLLSGTSMAAPHVAGLAALVKSAHPAFTNDDLRARILATAMDVGAPGPDPETGAGLVRGAAAL